MAVFQRDQSSVHLSHGPFLLLGSTVKGKFMRQLTLF